MRWEPAEKSQGAKRNRTQAAPRCAGPGEISPAKGPAGRVQGSVVEKMSTAVKIERKDVDEIPFQEASLDIWDRKYRLTAKDGTPIDATMDDTWRRVATTLAG